MTSDSTRQPHKWRDRFVFSLICPAVCAAGCLAVGVAGVQFFSQRSSRWLEIFASFDIASAQEQQNRLGKAALQQANHAVQDGDIIFRSGNSWLTRMAKQVAPETVYSHVGLVRVVEGQARVIHASVEPEDESRVIEEPLVSFLQKGNAHQVAVYRMKQVELQTQQTLSDVAIAYVEEAIPFDGDFDLATAEQVYCSELVWRVYLAADVDLSDRGFEQFSFPFSGDYVTPDSLSQSAHLNQVYELAY